jgi:hypothetical protein
MGIGIFLPRDPVAIPNLSPTVVAASFASTHCLPKQHLALVECQRAQPQHRVMRAMHNEDPLENLGMTPEFPQSLGLRVKEKI